MSTIEGVLPMERIKDRVIWAPSSSSRFFYRSFRRSIVTVGPVGDRWKSLWDLASKSQMFCLVTSEG